MVSGYDTRLREGFRLLGRLLGEALAELHGPGALALVEETRRAGGAAAPEVQALLDRLLVMPVLTAEPGEPSCRNPCHRTRMAG